MKIYTKTGDGGETSLFGGTRVSKDDARIDAYGCIDELNSCLGIVRAEGAPSEIDEILVEVQSDLFVLGADLATPQGSSSSSVVRIEAADPERLERHIDRLDALLPTLTTFILPGGCAAAARLHLARTVCRRAERLVVRLSKVQSVGATPVIYLNRLSDLLFVMARFANLRAGATETPWKVRRGSQQ